MFAWLWLLFTAVADCPQPISERVFSAAITAAEDRAGKRDPTGFGRDWEVLEQALPCVGGVLTPSQAARVHALGALQAMLANDEQGTLDGFRAAREADPSATRPEWLGDPGSVLELRYRASVPEEPTNWTSLTEPEGQTLYVDGVATAAVPDRKALLQGVGPEGQVMWTRRWAPGDALPEGYIADEEPPVETAGPAPAPSAGDADADKLVQELSNLLAQGKYEDVLRRALPAISNHPDYSATFQAIADIATGQLERRRSGSGVSVQSNLQRPPPSSPPPREYNTRTEPTYKGFYPTREDWKRSRKDLKGLRVGMDLGLPIGGRLEYKFATPSLDSIDLRVGANLNMVNFVYPYPGLEASLAVDFNLGRSDWQIEMIHGVTTGYYSLYPIFGGAIQYDPPTPLQVNFGFKIGGYALIPDIGVGFLW